ncbi:hypothetical protein T02_3003 [Trichinella nativa]|uniref:Uncharacterized protein n=1 Tax=Trichinella nativa TaxID=6335 RepID=A0A0V1KM34_9BILA|nr:hypothetical protein T02_3003 [Trichinella nativa]
MTSWESSSCFNFRLAHVVCNTCACRDIADRTYLVKPFATLNTMISAVSLRTVQRPCVLDCRKCPRELRKLLGKYHYV